MALTPPPVLRLAHTFERVDDAYELLRDGARIAYEIGRYELAESLDELAGDLDGWHRMIRSEFPDHHPTVALGLHGVAHRPHLGAA